MRLSSRLRKKDNPPQETKDLTNPLEKDLENRNPIESNLILQLSVVALHNSGLSQRSIANHVGLSPATVRSICNSPRLNDLLKDNPTHVKKALPKMLYQIATLSISSITKEDLLKLNAFQRMITAATAIDKARLMEDLPTQNVSIRELVPRLQENMDNMRQVYREAVDLLKQKDGSYAPNEGDA